MKKYLKIIGIALGAIGLVLFLAPFYLNDLYTGEYSTGELERCIGITINHHVCLGFSRDGAVFQRKLDFLENGTTKKLPERPYFKLGEKHIIFSREITEDGGEIVVKNTNTELDGIRIVVPAGAVDRKTKFSIGFYDNKKKLSNGSDLSTILIIETDRLNMFNQPVEIHHNTLGYYAYNVNISNSKGTLEPLTSLSVDEVILFRPQNNTISK